jgi:hypothetical protein
LDVVDFGEAGLGVNFGGFPGVRGFAAGGGIETGGVEQVGKEREEDENEDGEELDELDEAAVVVLVLVLLLLAGVLLGLLVGLAASGLVVGVGAESTGAPELEVDACGNRDKYRCVSQSNQTHFDGSFSTYRVPRNHLQKTC